MADWWTLIVAGLIGGTVPAVVTVRMQWKLQREQHTHDRAERLRARAVKGYELGLETAEHLATSTEIRVDAEDDLQFETWVARSMFATVGESCTRALAEFQYLSIDGWNESVRRTSSALYDALAAAQTRADAVRNEVSTQKLVSLFEGRDDHLSDIAMVRTMCDALESAVTKYEDALGRYKTAVAEH